MPHKHRKAWQQHKYTGTLSLIDRRPLATLSKHPPRSKNVTGYFDFFPTANNSFTIYAEPLENKNADFREYITSIIEAVETNGNTISFRTINSFYVLVFDEYF